MIGPYAAWLRVLYSSPSLISGTTSTADLHGDRFFAESFESLFVFELDVGFADGVERVFVDGVVDGFGDQLAQHFGADLVFVARADN